MDRKNDKIKRKYVEKLGKRKLSLVAVGSQVAVDTQ